MAARDTARVAEPRLRAAFIYAIAVLSSATGSFLATHRLLFDPTIHAIEPPIARFLNIGILIVPLLIVGPILLGYNGNSFLAGVLTGVMPVAGYTTSIWTWPPFDATRLEGMVAGALFGIMWVLPLASLLFIVGVALRRDGTLTEQNRALVLRLAAAILISVTIGFAIDTGLLQVHGDQ